MNLVSIIMPCYKRRETLPRAINSILNQDYQNFELIVIDNDSNDGTKEYINNINDERIKFFQINNKGIIAKSRNFGIKKARGEYIAFLDSDDWWLPRKLKTSVDYLDRGADFTYHDMYLRTNRDTISAESNINKRLKFVREVNHPIKNDLLNNGNAFSLSSVVLRKSYIADVGYFSEDNQLMPYDDFLTWIKISEKTNRFKKIDEVLGFYYWDGLNATTNMSVIGAMHRFLKLFEEFYGNKVPFWINARLTRIYFEKKKYLLSINNFIKYVLKFYFVIKLKNIFQKYSK